MELMKGNPNYCTLPHCPWSNGATGNCLWPRAWCPRLEEKEKFRRKQAWRRIMSLQTKMEVKKVGDTAELLGEYKEMIVHVRERRDELIARYREEGDNGLLERIRQLEISLRNLEYSAGEMSRSLNRGQGRRYRNRRRDSKE